MPKINYNILLGCTIISIGIILHGYITKPINNTIDEYQSSSTSKVFNLIEASEYLNMSELQVKGIITAEANRLKKYKSFSGTMLPYFKVDNEYYFYEDALNEWLLDVTHDMREYDSGKYEMKR